MFEENSDLIQLLIEEIGKITTLHKQQKYNEAFQVIENLLNDYPYSVELLVKRGRIIQLLNDNLSKFPTLDAAENSLKLANLIAPQSPEACLELGYFEYAVKNCSDEAIKYFRIAQNNAEETLRLAIIGQLKCYIDTGNIAQAKEVLKKAQLSFPDDDEVGFISFELEDYEL